MPRLDKAQLQRLALLRLEDADVLLAAGRWAAAYSLTGYAVECGLKACLLKLLGESGAVFGDREYLPKLAKGCWTHDLTTLVNLAGLDRDFGAARGANPTLATYWGLAKDWTETGRYEEKTETDAREMHKAVTDNPDGVFRWIQSRW